MAATDNQPAWVPYVPTGDCSMGFCSVYCPQWCYIIFPPPPTVEFSDGNSGLSFSPFVIAIITVLASALLLICYYTIVSKHCGGFNSLQRRFQPRGNDNVELDDDAAGQSQLQETSNASPSNGLDEALISKIAVHKYRKGEGSVQGTDCSVCLSEFREDDSLRLLPKCSHAFHVQCIDTWLRSHSNCPLCRASIVSMNPAMPAPPEPVNDPRQVEEMVTVVADTVAGADEGTELGCSDDAAKHPSRIYCDSGGMEERHTVVEIRDDDDDDADIQSMRRPFSIDASHHGRLSIAGVRRMSTGDAQLAATGASSSSPAAGNQSKGISNRNNGLHCVTSPVPVKRSFSKGSLHGKESNELPTQDSASE
ncbi:hypothetical protein B296_00031847 [Ensete ventricosum]|uniref:RING-type E3 ubiquitin transferase n=1 Tax=Ensete ventricosum TaxID=4639 RepID=A0A426YMT6_ENSVE|nr:hypothetical protein B296_00031847 [Ensete ventricosum]